MADDNPRTAGAFAEATSTVYGVATARFAHDYDGSALLIQRHLEEARAAGKTPVEAWSMLFSAAVVALTDELEARGKDERTNPMALLSRRAMEHAAGLEGS